MITEFFRRILGRAAASHQASPPNHPAMQIAAIPHPWPSDRKLFVLAKDRLINIHDEPPSAPRANGETWWLVANHDLKIEVSLLANDDANTDETSAPRFVVEAAIRFEPDEELLRLLAGREFVSTEDVAGLITTQLSGLLELDAARLQAPHELDAARREQLRARLSLLVQIHGLRCTGLSEFRRIEPPPNVAAVAEPSISESLPTAAQFNEVVQQVRSEEDWEELTSVLDDEGTISAEQANELRQLGQGFLDGREPAVRVASRLRELADQAARQANIPSPEIRRLRGLDLRLQSFEPTPNSSAEAARTPGGPMVRVKRRPWTWWMFSRVSIDERLRGYLQQTTRELRVAFDGYRLSAGSQVPLVPLRRIDERLHLLADLLATTPTLTPGQKELRVDRKRLREIVRSVERAATAAEMANAEVRQLRMLAPGAAEWTASADSIRDALDRMFGYLGERRHIH